MTADGEPGRSIVYVEIEPWDVQDYLFKRVFDVGFALVGLVVLSLVILLIAAAIKADDGGAVLYRQERTTVFGKTFDVFKFRSIALEEESATPIDDKENARVTRVGEILRQAHLNEIPGGDIASGPAGENWPIDEMLLRLVDLDPHFVLFPRN